MPWSLVASLVCHGLLVLAVSSVPEPRAAQVARPAIRSTEVEVVEAPSREAKAQPRSRVAPKRRAIDPIPPEKVLAKQPPVPAVPVPPSLPTPEVKTELVPSAEAARLKSVELQTPESAAPPEQARFLSDKDRRVEKETRSLQTNLERESPDRAPLAAPKAMTSGTPGSTEDVNAPEEDREKREQREAREAQAERSPLLRMRAPKEPDRVREEQEREEQEGGLAQLAPGGTLPPAVPAQAGQAARRPKLDLNLDDQCLDRIDGAAAAAAREQARLSPSVPSARKGRFERKWRAVRGALENFVSEVQPGNQTALNTRADPFAVYIAQMHRRIHELWGFGFLRDLDRKPDGNPMNDMHLWTMVELVVLPSGALDKATIVRPSGVLTFDVAAVDTVISASPYPPTPQRIRSANGNVYLHWRFHRDERQCGTFGVDPFILKGPPRGRLDRDRGTSQSAKSGA